MTVPAAMNASDQPHSHMDQPCILQCAPRSACILRCSVDIAQPRFPPCSCQPPGLLAGARPPFGIASSCCLVAPTPSSSFASPALPVLSHRLAMNQYRGGQLDRNRVATYANRGRAGLAVSNLRWMKSCGQFPSDGHGGKGGGEGSRVTMGSIAGDLHAAPGRRVLLKSSATG